MTDQSGSSVSVPQNSVVELSFHSTGDYASPFQEVDEAAVFTDPDGRTLMVPAFWAGDRTWRIRYSSPIRGRHTFVTRCSNAADTGLHGQQGVVEVGQYTGANPLLQHGRLRVSSTGRHLEHVDGTPFFWLADTWWLALVKRLRWPDDFQLLTADRVKKGFTVIQLVAGLFPEMEAFNPRGVSEAGFPWTEDFGRINPSFFDGADLKIGWLVQAGLLPCIVGAWGYYLRWTGVHTMKRHWQYLVARYGAYPVVWCLAGEAKMPWYSELWTPQATESARQLEPGWVEVARYLRAIDPYHHPITVHPSPATGDVSSYDTFADRSLFDFVMLQTGHSDKSSLAPTLRILHQSLDQTPPKPVINGEVCYEGIMGASWQDTQRFLFWSHMLSGAAGHSYGAQGMWAFNSGDLKEATGSAGSWGDATWREASQLPGSSQLGIGKRLLARYAWQDFEAHPEWVEPHWTASNRLLPYAAGIPKKVRVIYFPGTALPADETIESLLVFREIRICGLEPGVTYRARYVNPRTGEALPETEVPAVEGQWVISGGLINSNPSMEDWLLVLEAHA